MRCTGMMMSDSKSSVCPLFALQLTSRSANKRDESFSLWQGNQRKAFTVRTFGERAYFETIARKSS